MQNVQVSTYLTTNKRKSKILNNGAMYLRFIEIRKLYYYVPSIKLSLIKEKNIYKRIKVANNLKETFNIIKVLLYLSSSRLSKTIKEDK